MILQGIMSAMRGDLGGLANPSGGFVEALGGAPTASGQDVNETKAQTLSAMFCGVRVIAETSSGGPVNVFERLGGRKKRPADEHPAYKVLRRPNYYQTGMSLRESMAWCANIWGGGFSEIERDRRLNPIHLHFLHSSRVSPDDEAMRRGELVWNVITDTGRKKIPDADMLHLKGPGDGITGKPLVTLMREVLGRAIAVRDHGAQWFREGGRLQAILKHPGDLKEEKIKQILTAFQRAWSGGQDGKQKIGLLTNQLDFASSLATNNQDSQFLETEHYGIEEVCRVLNIQPHILKHLARATNNNIEHQGLEFYIITMLPWFRRFEEEFERKLLREDERERYYIRHNVDSILRGDYKSRMEGNAIGVQWGWLTRDEVRLRDDMDPLPDGMGAIPLVPTTHNPAHKLAADARKAGDDLAEDLDFKRAVVKQLIADGTIGDVMFNLTNGRDLLRQVNIPIQPGHEEPWLPVVAENGPLVSGETIKDDEGDIVGGDIEELPVTANEAPGVVERGAIPGDGEEEIEEAGDGVTENRADTSHVENVSPEPQTGNEGDGNGPPKERQPDDNETEEVLTSLLVHAASPVVRLTVNKLSAIERRGDDVGEFIAEHRTFVRGAVSAAMDAAFVMRRKPIVPGASEAAAVQYCEWLGSFEGKRAKLVEQQGGGKLVAAMLEAISR